jgi:hypothetical protein
MSPLQWQNGWVNGTIETACGMLQYCCKPKEDRRERGEINKGNEGEKEIRKGIKGLRKER